MKHQTKYDIVPEEFISEQVGKLKGKKNNNMQLFNWFWRSSANRNNIALTIKAGIPFLVLWGVSDTQTLNNLVGEIGTLVANIGQVVTGVIAAWGLIRKMLTK